MFQNIREIESWLMSQEPSQRAILVRRAMAVRDGDSFRIWCELAQKLTNQPELVSEMLRYRDWRAGFRGTAVAWFQHKIRHYEEDFIWRLSQGMGWGPQTLAAGWAVLTRSEYIPAMEAILIHALEKPIDTKWAFTHLSIYAALHHHDSEVAEKFADSKHFLALREVGYYDSVEITQSYIKIMLSLPDCI